MSFETLYEGQNIMPKNSDTSETKTIFLKKQLSRCSVEEKQRLNSFLSIFYGKAMVTQGLLAAAFEQVQRISKIQKETKAAPYLSHLDTTLEMIAEETQDVIALIDELEDLLEVEPPKSIA